jgi:hypothetical protein
MVPRGARNSCRVDGARSVPLRRLHRLQLPSGCRHPEGSSHVVHLDSGDLLTTLGPALVEPTLFADSPEGLDQDSALRVLVSSGDGARFLRPRIPSPPLSFGATAEYYRSGQPRVPLLLLGSAVDLSNPPCAGQGEYRDIETSVKTATAHPAFGWSAPCLREPSDRHFRIPIERPQRVPVPDCGASYRLRALLKWPKPLERGSLYPRGLESQTSLHRFAVSVQARLPALPSWRPLACGHLPSRRLGPSPDKSGSCSEVCLAALPTRCLGVWSLTRRAVGTTRYLP